LQVLDFVINNFLNLEIQESQMFSFSGLASIGIHLIAILIIGASFLPTRVTISPLKKPVKFELMKRKPPATQVKPRLNKLKKIKRVHRIRKAPLPSVRKLLQASKVVPAPRKVVLLSKPLKKNSIIQTAKVEKPRIRYLTRTYKKMTVASIPGSSLEVLPVTQFQTKMINTVRGHKLPTSLPNIAKPIRPSALPDYIESKTMKKVLNDNSAYAFLHAKFEPRPGPYMEIRGEEDFVDGYLRLIRDRLERVKRYPRFAKRSGMTGKVFVKFTITQLGNAKNIIVVKASPFKKLNEEAVSAVKRATPFPEFPAAIKKKEVRVTIPFLFQLN
tara:strand:+ start:760 stop:1746 length:987 start_codon:yes stop_codon:yes gene_type:complete